MLDELDQKRKMKQEIEERWREQEAILIEKLNLSGKKSWKQRNAARYAIEESIDADSKVREDENTSGVKTKLET